MCVATLVESCIFGIWFLINGIRIGRAVLRDKAGGISIIPAALLRFTDIYKMPGRLALQVLWSYVRVTLGGAGAFGVLSTSIKQLVVPDEYQTFESDLFMWLFWVSHGREGGGVG